MGSKTKRISILAIVLAVCMVVSLVLVLAFFKPPAPNTPTEPNTSTQTGNRYTHTEALDMKVSVIDIGQGDAMLIESEGHVLLVDAGDVGKGDEVVEYLEGEGIREIDYVVATHPDADHIGGMPEVFAAFDVENDVLAPTITARSQTYGRFIAAVEAEPDVELITPAVGQSFTLGDASFVVLANGDGATKTNDASIVIRVTCDGRSILLMGDMPEKGELQLVNFGTSLSSDVLKVGHHGSRYSSSTSFLAAVHPHFAVISCGVGNGYKHPHPEALDRLNATGATIYRTDTQGTVIFLFSDGLITPAISKAA